jgi:uncharacterized protein (DUF1697 family)
VSTRVALLRAVNVGGRNRIPMAELRAALEAEGLTDVVTVLQSGNVLFDGGGAEPAAIATIRTAVAQAFGLEIGVAVRSAEEMSRIAGANPFLANGERRDPGTLQVAFLDEEPAAAAAAKLDPERSPPDAFCVHGREVYLSYPGGSGRSRLTLDYLERTLAVGATSRNWRTVQRLADQLRSREP